MDWTKIFGDLLQKIKDANLYDLIVAKLDAAKLLLDNGKLIDNTDNKWVRNDTGEWLPKSKIGEINDKHSSTIKDQADKLELLEKQVKDGGNAHDLIAKLKEESKTASKTHDTDMVSMKLDHAIDMGIYAVNPVRSEYHKPIKALLNREGMILQGDVVVGLTEQLKGIQENDAYKMWFASKKVEGEHPEKNHENGNIWKGKKPEELTLTDKLVLKKADPTLHKEMFPND